MKENKEKIKLEDLEASGKVAFEEWDDVISFLYEDCWDTYQELVDVKWDSLKKRQQTKLKSKTNFIDNKNAAVATLNMFYDGAIKFIEDELKFLKEEQKKLVAFDKNNV